jgi:hypothetical protein
MKGIQRFDPGKGAALSTYLTQTILNALACAVAQQGHVIQLFAAYTRNRSESCRDNQEGRRQGAATAKCQTNGVPAWSEQKLRFSARYQQNRHYLYKSRSTTFPKRPWKT